MPYPQDDADDLFDNKQEEEDQHSSDSSELGDTSEPGRFSSPPPMAGPPPYGSGDIPDRTPEHSDEREARLNAVTKPVDTELISYLIDYAACNPECPPLLKAYLEEVVLPPPAPGEGDRARRVEFYLRNPAIVDYGLGSEFTEKLRPYRVYRAWEIKNPALPYAPIPEKYQPRPPESATVAAGLAREESIMRDDERGITDEVGGGGGGGAGTGEKMTDEERGEARTTRLVKRLREVTGDDTIEGGDDNEQPTDGEERDVGGEEQEEEEEGERFPRKRRRVAGDAETDLDRRTLKAISEALERLAKVPRLRGWVSVPPETGEGVGPEWTTDSWYCGWRQPPLPLRLQHVINFLADEDVDRCGTWLRQFLEVVEYLYWLGHKDGEGQLDHGGVWTHTLFENAVAMARAHILFLKRHYDPVPLEIAEPPPTLPGRSTRLDWAGSVHDWPGVCHCPAVPRENQPRPLQPREPTPVNNMPLVNPSGGAGAWERFADDSKEFWRSRYTRDDKGEPLDEANNLACIESRAFLDEFGRSSPRGASFNEATGGSDLPDDTPAVPEDAPSWARERGIRRAGLQEMLRRFTSREQRELPSSATTPVVLPVDALVLRQARQRPLGPQWRPPALPRDQMPAHIEPQPFTVYYRRYLQDLRRTRESTLLWLQRLYKNNKSWMPVPRNVIIGAPFVWGMVSRQMQSERDLLVQCQRALRVLQAAHMRVPRELLRTMLDLVDRALAGEFHDHSVPPEVRLADDEWAGSFPNYLHSEDLQWIKFLASESVNPGTASGRFQPDTPHDKYRIFLIFAVRVQKLLDDRNPEGLFGRHDSEVTVEELLDAINAGVGTSATRKVKFGPYDACAFLTRLHKSGHVRFREDPTCYGVIERPTAQYHPEDRVRWTPDDPAMAEIGVTAVRPNYLGGISDWPSVIREGAHVGPDTLNFFAALGYRLGYTIYMLRLLEAELRPEHLLSSQFLRASIDEWSNSCKKPDLAALIRRTDPSIHLDPFAGEDELLPVIRTRIIDEISANETMLAPAREHHYLGVADGLPRVALVWDHNWDWASEKVRGKAAPRFWSVDRWPQGSGYLATDEEVPKVNDELDPGQTYDPVAADPMEDRVYRPRLRRYGEDMDKVKFRPGQPVFPVGDTRRQQRAIEAYMTDMVQKGEYFSLSRKKI